MTVQGLIFPIELIEAIIDHFHSDKKSLKACSLVCKAWTSRTRFHLFACLNLQRQDVETFINSSSRINIVHFVRHLRLIRGCWYSDSGPWEEIIPRLVDFHNVRHLGLFDLTLGSSKSSICSALVGQFAHIVDLCLTGVQGTSFAAFAEVICAFPSLETLGLNSIWWTSSIMPAQTLSPPRNLHSLQMTGNQHGIVLKWLLSLHAIPALHTLYLYDGDLRDGEITKKLLKALSPFLEALVVSSWIDYYSCGMSILLASIHTIRSGQTIDLPHLRSIQIEVFEDDYAVKQILSCITSLKLEDIAFLYLVDDEDYEDHDPDNDLWLELDAILARPQFSKLTKVSITFTAFSPADEFYRQWFVDHLPQCHARGILVFHIGKRSPRISGVLSIPLSVGMASLET